MDLEESVALAKRDTAEMMAAVGEMLVTWNGLETQVRNLLVLIVSAPEEHLMRAAGDTNVKKARRRAELLTTTLKAVELGLKLRAFSVVCTPLQAEHIKHLADLFDRLREYRNFYVHGMRAPGASVATDGSVTTTALAVQTVVRKSLAIRSVRFGIDALHLFRDKMWETGRYVDPISHDLINPDLPDNQRSPMFPPLHQLAKPAIPPKLVPDTQVLLGEPIE